MTQLTRSEAVQLAHALVDRVAQELDVRVLFIKGPIASTQGLRGLRGSVDVDVLVDPTRRSQLAERLTQMKWVDEHPYTSPTVLPMHSMTHRHTQWSCELDLHDRFPGFFADPQQVFELLWDRREAVEVATRTLACPDPVAHALILALHSLRDPHDAGKAHELSQLVETVGSIADTAWLSDLAQLAGDLGAADTAAPFLERVGAPEVGRGSTSPEDIQAWSLRTNPIDATAVSWVNELLLLPWRRRPGYLWYAAVLSEKELRLADPWLPPGRRAILRARIRRLLRGVRAVPRALVAVRDVSRRPPSDPS